MTRGTIRTSTMFCNFERFWFWTLKFLLSEKLKDNIKIGRLLIIFIACIQCTEIQVSVQNQNVRSYQTLSKLANNALSWQFFKTIKMNTYQWVKKLNPPTSQKMCIYIRKKYHRVVCRNFGHPALTSSFYTK